MKNIRIFLLVVLLVVVAKTSIFTGYNVNLMINDGSGIKQDNHQSSKNMSLEEE
mgnify:CR=1 FL=1